MSKLEQADEFIMDELYHFGTPQDGSGKGSGRYRLGSGKEPYQDDRFNKKKNKAIKDTHLGQTKDVKKMTYAELEEAIERISLEKDYIDKLNYYSKYTEEYIERTYKPTTKEKIIKFAKEEAGKYAAKYIDGILDEMMENAIKESAKMLSKNTD